MTKKTLIYEVLWIVCILAAGSLLWYIRHLPPPPVRQGEVITYSEESPSEQKIDRSTYRWQGAPADPKYIRLPSIGTEGFIQKMGVDQHRAIAAPPNVHMAGWFVDSVRPGEPGLSIIDGHVDGPTAPGIFKRLAELKEGDEYTVERGDGIQKRYQVRRITSVRTQDAVGVLFSQDPDVPSQLTLITCGGSFDRQTRQYDQRVIVVSVLLEDRV